MKPDRIVVGAEGERAISLLRAVYAPFQRNRDKLVVMDVRSAELTKYAANAMLATRISFMNELALLAEIAGRRHRAGAPGHRLRPAHRLPLPVRRLRLRRLVLPEGRQGADPHRRRDRPRPEGAAGRRGRQRRAEAGAGRRRSCARFGEDLAGKRFAVWGLAFKPNTDDMREASARVLIGELLARGATVTAYDPVAMTEARRIFGDEPRIAYAENPDAALVGADALAIVTEWKEFRSPDFARIASTLEDAGDLRRPQPVRAEGRAGRRHRLPADRARVKIGRKA